MEKQGDHRLALALASSAAVVVTEAPPTYGVSASVTYIAGRAMAATLIDALESRQSGENEGREEEQEAAWAERPVSSIKEG